MWEGLKKNDYAAVFEYLERHSPFTCPIYGNAASAGLAYKPFAMRSGFFYVYKKDKEILGIVAGFNDGNVMVHTESEQADIGILKVISSLPFHSVWGLSGRLPGSTSVTNLSGVPLDSRVLNVMVYNGQPIPSSCPGCEAVRIDTRFLSPAYISFIKKCLWEGFGFKSNSWDLRKRMKERSGIEPYWLLAQNGKYVAQAHVQAITSTHAYIGGVCTPRDERRKGYAKEIMKYACEYAAIQGRTPALSVSDNNKAAVKLYEELGFEKIGTMLVYMKEREFKGDENT